MNISEINSKQQFNFSCIYLWKNLVNGKVYVGQTQNFYDRMNKYKQGRDANRLIGQALVKYGFDNFDVSVLERDVELECLNEREQYWMDYYNCYNPDVGYNVCSEANTTRGYHHTEEAKQRMSETRKRLLQDRPELVKIGADNPMFGKTMSEENKAKLRERNKGNQFAKGKHWQATEEFKEKHRLIMLGKKNSLGYKHTQETKNKIAEANRHRVISEETKAKQSESHKGLTAKKVICVETGVIYDSIKAASAAVKRDGSAISKCCRGKQATVAGYHWRYYED